MTEHGFDLGAQVGHELGDVGMAGLAVVADGNELDVALALAVGQQHDVEHDAGVVGTAGDDLLRQDHSSRLLWSLGLQRAMATISLAGVWQISCQEFFTASTLEMTGGQ